MLLSVQNLSGGYREKEVCKNISFEIEKGEIISVLGPNGSGKTTLFRLLLESLPHSSGDILINGVNTKNFTRKEMAKNIAYIPQYHSPIFSYSVLEIVLMGRSSYVKEFSSPKKVDIDKAFEALHILGIEELANIPYTDLSGGQCQMVLIARAICQEAKLFIMDEPSSSLDYSNHQILIKTLTSLVTKGYSILLSTHSPDQPFSVASKAMMLKEGKVIAFGEVNQTITEENLKLVYGIDMDILQAKDRNGNIRSFCLPVIAF